jgi:hypothetical protein
VILEAVRPDSPATAYVISGKHTTALAVLSLGALNQFLPTISALVDEVLECLGKIVRWAILKAKPRRRRGLARNEFELQVAGQQFDCNPNLH